MVGVRIKSKITRICTHKRIPAVSTDKQYFPETSTFATGERAPKAEYSNAFMKERLEIVAKVFDHHFATAVRSEGKISQDTYKKVVCPALTTLKGCDIETLAIPAIKAFVGIRPPTDAKELVNVGAYLKPFVKYQKLFEFLRKTGTAETMGFGGALHCEVTLSSFLYNGNQASSQFTDGTQFSPEVSCFIPLQQLFKLIFTFCFITGVWSCERSVEEVLPHLSGDPQPLEERA